MVAGRSYGTPRTMVNRGPQFVQLMNGWRYRRSAGSASSARQSSQVAVSGEMSVRFAPPAGLGAMTKPVAPVGATTVAVIRSITASGGASAASAARNASIARPGALDLDEDAGGVVPDQPAEAVPDREGVHVRPEADALHHALDPNPRAHQPALSPVETLASG